MSDFGSMRLGCLVGLYDQAQSFETVTNLSIGGTSGVESYDQQTTDVHSSETGYFMYAEPGADFFIQYNYSLDLNLSKFWSSQVNTHTLQTVFWARSVNAVDVLTTLELNGVPSNITADNSSLQFHSLITDVQCTVGVTLRFRIDNNSAATNGFIYIDDILTAIDTFDIPVDRIGAKFYDKKNIIDHWSIGGDDAFYQWGKHRRFELPVSFFPSSLAHLVNSWWSNGVNLFFTENSSDSEAYRIVRCVNDSTPFTELQMPYQDMYRGALLLETIDDSLVY